MVNEDRAGFAVYAFHTLSVAKPKREVWAHSSLAVYGNKIPCLPAPVLE